MTDANCIALINAELDGELDSAARAELARRLLVDPQARALREDYRRLGMLLDAMPEVEPPVQLREHILAALPQSPRRRLRSLPSRWRLAAVLAGVVAAGAIVFEVAKGPGPSSGELSGTIAATQQPTMVDTVRLGEGPISGRVSLYRDRSQLIVNIELAASAPVDVLITGGAQAIHVSALGGAGKSTASSGRTVPLPGFPMNGQAVELAFLMGGRPVAHATLRAPAGR